MFIQNSPLPNFNVAFKVMAGQCAVISTLILGEGKHNSGSKENCQSGINLGWIFWFLP